MTYCRAAFLFASGAALSAALGAAETPLATGWDRSTLPTWTMPVAAKALVVDGPVDIRWVPEPFVFAAGPSRRFIDHADGDDSQDGSTPATAWKHHPWDDNAAGRATSGGGHHTYVFKRGVTYRGHLRGSESGTAREPIRLTSDPAWGAGEATIAGSFAVHGGWQRVPADEAKRLGCAPSVHDQLWSVTLPGTEIPRALWQIGTDGKRVRQTLARWPNWRIEHPYNHFTQWLRVEKINKGFPKTTIFAPKVLNDKDPNAYRGATVWVDHPNSSGEFSIMGPISSGIGKYNPTEGSIQVDLNHPVRHPAPNSPFYLENLPRFLDEAGEWWFSAKDRRLYLAVAGKADPNQSHFEAARHDILIDLVDQQHIEISGLTLTGGNCPDLNMATDVGDYNAPNRTTQMAAIRMTGNCQDITLRQIAIVDTAGTGIANLPTAASNVLRGIRIMDSRFERIDNDAIYLVRGLPWRRAEPHPKGRLTELSIYRNRFADIGLRCSEPQGGRGMELIGLEVADIAGNVLTRLAAQGINVHGGRSGGSFLSAAAETPLVRIQIRHNKVVDSLLHKTDFGGIEFWGSGPCYVYGNLSIDPVGFVAHRNVYHKNEAFYFDHGVKAYLFNNIGWSQRRDDAWKGVMGSHFIHEVRTRWNQVFHNTACDFRAAQSLSMQHGDQQHYLGNLFMDSVLGHLCMWNLDQSQAVAYANNLMSGSPEHVYDRWKGDKFRTVDELRDRLAVLPNHLSPDPGWVTDESPVINAAQRDFRLTDSSAAIDRGVRVFVPWSLAGTVGEWHFRLHPADPGTVMAHDVFAQEWLHGTSPMQLGDREGKAHGVVPGNVLHGSAFTAADYRDGPLEDWVRGAVHFDGTKHLTLPNQRLLSDFVRKTNKGETITVPGRDRKTVRMQDNNFIIEAVVRVDGPGSIVRKLDDAAGYALDVDARGRTSVRLRTAGADTIVTAGTSLIDGTWHHILAEVDRVGQRVTIFINGNAVSTTMSGPLPTKGASLDTDADFFVGHGFTGALDFLRLAQGTLADAQTTIGELMTWQFNGPADHDFAGRPATGAHRDVGALEHPTVAGRKAIRYTPPTPPTPPAGIATVSDQRFEIAQPWGSVSVPKQSARGADIEIQVTFGTEAILKRSTVGVDLIGWKGDTRLGVLASSPRLPVEPGVTTPFVLRVKIPTAPGLTNVTAMILAGAEATADKATISTEIALGLEKP